MTSGCIQLVLISPINFSTQAASSALSDELMAALYVMRPRSIDLRRMSASIVITCGQSPDSSKVLTADVYVMTSGFIPLASTAHNSSSECLHSWSSRQALMAVLNVTSSDSKANSPIACSVPAAKAQLLPAPNALKTELQETESGFTKVACISWNTLRTRDQRRERSAAQMAPLHAITFGRMPLAGMQWYHSRARRHWPPARQPLMRTA
mmetsp:Transcript_11680/g.24196  ORF Transcript_11680/g.24196 Transcript_11680/m.24196 type:complete len:209 (-) Transcript_11680:365-991(-)